MDRCSSEPPDLYQVEGTLVRCLLYDSGPSAVIVPATDQESTS